MRLFSENLAMAVSGKRGQAPQKNSPRFSGLWRSSAKKVVAGKRRSAAAPIEEEIGASVERFNVPGDLSLGLPLPSPAEVITSPLSALGRPLEGNEDVFPANASAEDDSARPRPAPIAIAPPELHACTRSRSNSEEAEGAIGVAEASSEAPPEEESFYSSFFTSSYSFFSVRCSRPPSRAR